MFSVLTTEKRPKRNHVILVLSILSLLLAFFFFTTETSSPSPSSNTLKTNQIEKDEDEPRRNQQVDRNTIDLVERDSSRGNNNHNNVGFSLPKDSVLRILELGKISTFRDSMLPSRDCDGRRTGGSSSSSTSSSCRVLDGSIETPCSFISSSSSSSSSAGFPCGIFLQSNQNICQSGKLPLCCNNSSSSFSNNPQQQKRKIPFSDVNTAAQTIISRYSQALASSSADSSSREVLLRRSQKEAKDLFRTSCSWDLPPTEQERKQWKLGMRLRSIATSSSSSSSSSVQFLTDCCVPLTSSSSSSSSSSSYSAVSLIPTVHHKYGSDLFSPQKELFEKSEKFTKKGQDRNTENENSENDKKKKQQTTRKRLETRKTKYRRLKRSSWIAVDNVCASFCDDDEADSFLSKSIKGQMNPNRRNGKCFTSLFSLNVDAEKDINAAKLAARNRGGRHSIFYGREASFGFAGDLADNVLNSKGKTKNNNQEKNSNNNNNNNNIKWIDGTTIYLSSFSASNVGHVIHDGLLGTAGAIASLPLIMKSSGASPSSSSSSAPSSSAPSWSVQFLVEDDLFNSSTPFFSFITSSLALNSLRGFEGEKKKKINEEDDDDSYSPPILLVKTGKEGDGRGKRRRRREIFCFDTLVISGGDRTGTGSVFASKETVALLIRNSVFAYLDSKLLITRKKSENKKKSKKSIKIYVYGRSDVYRRSIDNFGALVSAVKETISSYSSSSSHSSSIDHDDDDSASVVSSASVVEPTLTLITTWYASPAAQISLARDIDVFVTAQGAHEQTVALFGAKDLSIIEICPCNGKLTSFVGRFGMFLNKQKEKDASKNKNKKSEKSNNPFSSSIVVDASYQQRLYQLQVCSPMINMIENDVGQEQNLTLCPHHLVNIQQVLEREINRIRHLRGL